MSQWSLSILLAFTGTLSWTHSMRDSKVRTAYKEKHTPSAFLYMDILVRFVNLTQTRIGREEGALAEAFPPPDWMVSLYLGAFTWLVMMRKKPSHGRVAAPVQDVLGNNRKQAEKGVDGKTASCIPLCLCCTSHLWIPALNFCWLALVTDCNYKLNKPFLPMCLPLLVSFSLSHPFTFNIRNFIFLYSWVKSHCLYLPHFISHLPVGGHLDWFHFQAEQH